MNASAAAGSEIRMSRAADIPGAPVFDGAPTLRGYAFNKMDFSLDEVANRARLVLDEVGDRARFRLDARRRDAVGGVTWP